MRTELERRPLILALAGLVVGLTAPGFLLNLAFGVAGLVWLRGFGPRLAIAIGFCLGALLAPVTPDAVSKPMAVNGVYTVVSAPVHRPEGGAVFLAEGPGGRIEIASPNLVPVLGDDVAIQGQLRPLPQERERTYLSRGVSGVMTGTATTVTVVRRASGPAAWGASWRESFIEFARRRLAPADAAVATALAFDDRSGLSQDDRTALERSGTVHVLAASGLHLLALAWALELVLSRLPITLLVRRALILALVLVYSAAAGFHPGAFRALVSTALRDGALIAGREYDALSGIGLAGMAYLLWRPYMVYDAGFQLSMVIGSGIALFGLRSAGMAPLPRLARGSLVAWLVSVPIVAHLFGIVSLVAIPANLVAVALLPICLLGLLAGHALSFVWAAGSDAVMVPTTLAAHGLEAVINGFGSWRGWGFTVPAFSGYWLAVVYGAALLLWRPKARPVT